MLDFLLKRVTTLYNRGVSVTQELQDQPDQ